jgi:ribosomal protein S18 acetylase RimI-like enzyme
MTSASDTWRGRVTAGDEGIAEPSRMSATASPSVVPASPEDRDRATATLVAAFVDDPLIRWMFPDAEQYLRVFPELLLHFGGSSYGLGTAHRTDDHAGVVLWLPPGERVGEEALGELMQRELAPDRLGEVFEFMVQVGESHPQIDHWYLPVIGVDPVRQGRGYGSLLLARTVAEIDAHGATAYLESSNVANIPLYERFGFEVVAEIQSGDSPTIWPMLRPARSSG